MYIGILRTIRSVRDRGRETTGRLFVLHVTGEKRPGLQLARERRERGEREARERRERGERDARERRERGERDVRVGV